MGALGTRETHMDELKDAMTNKQIAQELGISVNTILRLQNEGVLPYWTPNGVTRPRYMWRSDVIAWRLGKLKPSGT